MLTLPKVPIRVVVSTLTLRMEIDQVFEMLDFLVSRMLEAEQNPRTW
jgi:hypothetical protein